MTLDLDRLAAGAQVQRNSSARACGSG